MDWDIFGLLRHEKARQSAGKQGAGGTEDSLDGLTGRGGALRQDSQFPSIFLFNLQHPYRIAGAPDVHF
jgi:hypothetical protein